MEPSAALLAPVSLTFDEISSIQEDRAGEDEEN